MRDKVATAAATVIVLVVLGAFLAPARAKGNAVIRAVPVYDIGNAVEVAANGLLGQGWELVQIDRPEAYYPSGDHVVYIWVKGYGQAPAFDAQGGLHGEEPAQAPAAAAPAHPATPNAGCFDYDPNTPGIQGPFPGATCYLGAGGWGWK